MSKANDDFYEKVHKEYLEELKIREYSRRAPLYVWTEKVNKLLDELLVAADKKIIEL